MSGLRNKVKSPKHCFVSFFFFQEVIDTSGGCGAKFSIVIVTEQFEGKRLLERHRLVNGALAEEMKEIHALSITKAATPEQWKQQQESEKSQATA
ncbi:protein BOLA2 isoform X1 [Nicotiana sylvestris]|uniref:protein BOLA2 isoform X1 n=1 Tax=Nicotiana sylvestris TaxID=4096 RepID=UPI00388C3C17